jgi:acyl carrier protein
MDPVTPEAIEATVRAVVADSLAVPRDQVTAESRLVDDLGADSLDFIDILFSLEKAFAIKVRESELDFLARLDFSSPEVMKDGYLTAGTVERLREWLPLLDRVPDAARVTPRELFSMITVETLAILIGRKLGRR